MLLRQGQYELGLARILLAGEQIGELDGDIEAVIPARRQVLANALNGVCAGSRGAHFEAVGKTLRRPVQARLHEARGLQTQPLMAQDNSTTS